MPTGMGNLLETDSDVASISDNEKERTDGDGMESDILVDAKNTTGKNAVVLSDGQHKTDFTARASTSVADLAQNMSSQQETLVSGAGSSNNGINDLLPQDNQSRQLRPKCASTSDVSIGSPGSCPSINKSAVFSPRELPPRSQLIQLKPVLCKPRLNNKSLSTDSPETVNKQKNPRFVPYEPYRGAVRPIVAQDDDTSKKHSRTASDVSSNSLEQAINSIQLDDTFQDLQQNTQNQEKVNFDKKLSSSLKYVSDAQLKKHEQIIQKQMHALTLLKERIKIAEKDNNDLHKENTRLKKLLVDSLSGDIVQQDPSRVQLSASESVDALSNEIEVWRSKFLSSCVLVEQLTRENGTLNDSVGSAANILKEVKLSSSLPPDVFEQVNSWLRTNRSNSLHQINSETS